MPLVRFARFVLVGGIATAVQYVILVALVRAAAVSPTIASSVGFVISACLNYLMNYHFTFRSGRSHGAAACKFALLALAGLIINASVMRALTQTGLHYVIAQICATAVVVLWNYFGNSLWTFGTLKTFKTKRHA